jgi:hypothetical protein
VGKQIKYVEEGKEEKERERREGSTTRGTAVMKRRAEKGKLRVEIRA